jgi:hypothetical protein
VKLSLIEASPECIVFRHAAIGINALQLRRIGSAIQMTLRTGQRLISERFRSTVENFDQSQITNAALACLGKFDHSYSYFIALPIVNNFLSL